MKDTMMEENPYRAMGEENARLETEGKLPEGFDLEAACNDDKFIELLHELEPYGAHIIPDTCPDQPCWHYLKGKIGITESPKCAYYPQRRGIHFIIRDLDTCIAAALAGEVK